MQLRYNKILKLLAILLFSFELLAPAVFPSSAEAEKQDSINITHLTQSAHSLDFLSHLIFEEGGSEEEREAKHGVTNLFFTEVFSELKKFEPANINWQSPVERFDTQPSLFRLYRVLII